MGTSPDIDWNKLEAALTKMEAVRAKLDRTTRERDGSQVLPQALTLMSQFTSLGATAVKLLGVPGGVDRVIREVARDLKETADITWTTPWEFLKMTPQLWGGIHSFVDMLRQVHHRPRQGPQLRKRLPERLLPILGHPYVGTAPEPRRGCGLRTPPGSRNGSRRRGRGPVQAIGSTGGLQVPARVP